MALSWAFQARTAPAPRQRPGRDGADDLFGEIDVDYRRQPDDAGGDVTELVQYVVDDAGSVLTVEVGDDDVPDDLVLASRPGGDTVGRAAVTLQQALETLRPALTRVAEMARSMGPTEATVEIGLKLGGETGVIVAKGTAEANLKLKLVWKSD